MFIQHKTKERDIYKSSIITKYIILGLIILAVIFAFTALSFRLTNRIKDDAKRINLAGKQRMLNFEMAWLIDESLKETGEDKDKTLARLKENISTYEEVLYAIRDGSRKYGIESLSHHKTLLNQNEKLIERWKMEINPALMQSLKGSPENHKNYNAIISSYVGEIDKFVEQLEKIYTEEIRLYSNLRLGILVVAFFTFTGITYYVKHYLVRPIKIIRKGTIEVGKGNFDVNI